LILTVVACSCQLVANDHTLVARLSYVLKSVEATLELGTKLNFSDPYDRFFSSYVWNVVVPLLNNSGFSQEILIYLEDLAGVIGLLCHDLWEGAAEKTRHAVLLYLWVSIVYCTQFTVLAAPELLYRSMRLQKQ
jgi:hypothetical protein